MTTLSPKESAAEHLRHIEGLVEWCDFDSVSATHATLATILCRAKQAREALEAGARTPTDRLTLDVDALEALPVAAALQAHGRGGSLSEAEVFIEAARTLARHQRETADALDSLGAAAIRPWSARS